MIRTGIALVAVAVFTALPAAAHAPGKKSNDMVMVVATAGQIENDTQKVTFTVDVEKGWHIYANPVGHDDLADNKTVVEISGGATKLKSVKITYPPGTLVKDDVVGNYMIYQGKITITAEVVRAKGDTEPLSAKIKVQACSEGKDGVCLQPGTVEVKDIK
jgi:uncharacterized protein